MLGGAAAGGGACPTAGASEPRLAARLCALHSHSMATPARSHRSACHPAQVVAASGSGVASFAVCRDGSLFAFGSSKRGQLGLGSGTQKAAEPQQLRLPAAAVQVSAGWGHAAALLGEGPPLFSSCCFCFLPPSPCLSLGPSAEDSSLYSRGWPASGRLGHYFASSGKRRPPGCRWFSQCP